MLNVALNSKTLWAQIEAFVVRGRSVLDDSRSRLANVENYYARCVQLLGKNEGNAVTSTRRILNSFERRLEKLVMLYQDHSSAALNQALSLIEAPYTFPNDPMNSVIDADPMPDIPARELLGTLNHLLMTLEQKTRARA